MKYSVTGELTEAASYLFNVIAAVTKIVAEIIAVALPITTKAELFSAGFTATIIIQSST